MKVNCVMGLCVFIAAVLLVCKVSDRRGNLGQYALENIEALADEETPTFIECYMSGNVTCPIEGSKVEYVVEGYALR